MNVIPDSGTIFETGSTECPDITYLDDTHFVIAYRDEGDSDKGKCIAGSTSGVTPTLGSIVEFESGNVTALGIAVLDSTHFVIAYVDHDDADKGKCVVGSVSGTTITLGSIVTFEVDDVNGIDVCGMDSTHFVITYANSTDGEGQAIGGSVSGTTITMGSADIWLSTIVSASFGMSICSMSSTHFVIAYRSGTGSQDNYAVSGTISGNTVSITVDSGTEFEASTLGAISIASLSSSSFVIAYTDVSNSLVGKAIAGTLSGTAITISSGTGTTFETGPLDIYHKRISITSPNSSQFVISFVDEGDSYKGKVIQGAVSGTTIDVTLDSATTFETGSCGTGSLDWCTVAILGDYFAIAFTDNGDSNKGKVILGRYSAVRSGVVSISSVPSISVSGNATKNGAASISVVPSLTLVGNFQTIGMVSINAVSSLYMAGGTTKQGGVSIASIAFMIATWQTSGICSIQSIPSVLADGARSASGGVTINVVPSLSLDGMNLANGVAAISAVSSMSALADKYKFGTVTISSTSSMSALGVAYFAQIMGYTGTLTAGDVLVIDCDEQTVELNGANVTKYFTGEFPQLYSGINELLWEDGGETPDVTFKTSHEPRYL